MAIGLPLIGYGIIYHTSLIGKALLVIGPLITISALIGWGIEPLEEPEDHDDEGEAGEGGELVGAGAH